MNSRLQPATFPSSLPRSSLLPLPPLQRVSPCLQRATFSSSPTRSSLSCPPASEPTDVPCFQAHKWTPPSSSPPVGESSFAMCHVSELSNPLLPLPPLKLVIPRNMPRFLPNQPASPSSSPPVSKSSFVIDLLPLIAN